MYAQVNNIELRILVKGKPITNYFHNGKNFVEGRDGSKFEIEVYNRNPFKVEAVISVDGTSVIDGQPAGPQSAGYLVEANSSVRIPGWKVSDAVAAAFEFTGKGGSYTTQMTGSSANNGVIGVMAFKDRNYRPYVAPPINAVPYHGALLGAAVMPKGGQAWNHVQTSYTSGQDLGGMASLTARSPGASMRGIAPSGAAASVESYTTTAASDLTAYAADASISAALNNLGTGFGEATDFKTETVKFDRGDLQAVLAVYYDNARGLKARGIEVGRHSRTRHTAVEPQAFPAMNCPIPKGWQG